MSSALLSLVSPVLGAMICGNFRESDCLMIKLDSVEEECFLKLVRVACGVEGLAAEDMKKSMDIGALAGFLQMEAVATLVENFMIKNLSRENCIQIFLSNKVLERLRTECYKMLRDEFLILSRTDDFLLLNEQTLGELLESDDLGPGREEDVFEALLRWLMVRPWKKMRAQRLLRKIRFGIIGDQYLDENMLSVLPGHRALEDLVRETMAKKGVGSFADKWMIARKTKCSIFGSDVLQFPQSVTFDRQGRIVVSDSGLNEVIVFNLDGSIALRFGSQGTAPGQFNVPYGVAAYGRNQFVVADEQNERIQVLNSDGSVERCFGSDGTAEGELSSPTGLAIDSVSGHIVVADTWNSRFQVFGVDGSFKFVRQGSRLPPAKDFAIDRAGRMVVSNAFKNEVQVVNEDGSVALRFGSEGGEPGQLSNPGGVAVDRDGRYVVADTNNDRVQVFNADGSVARVISTAGDGVGELRKPRSVAVDGAGRIAVADTGNRRVQLF